MADQLFFGSLYGSPLGSGSNSVIRFSGGISGNTVTQSTPVSGYLDIASVTVGMVVRGLGADRTVTAVNASNFIVDGPATNTPSATVRVAPPAGGYYVSASIFSDPNNVLTVNDITGSNNTDFLPSSSRYAVHGKADSKTGIFHQYLITNVTERDNSADTISFFMEWNESGSEADTGDSLSANAQYMAVHELSHEYKLAPNLSRRVGDLANLEVGADQAGYNISLDNFDDLNTGSFTGSFHGELTGSFLGTGSGQFTGSFTGSGHITLADTASTADDFLVRQDLTVVGTGSFGFIQTTYTSASVIYSSGSTKFGDTNDDVHEITGSLSLSGSNVDFLNSTGVSGSFSGSFEGDGRRITGIESASYAVSASSAEVADTASHAIFAEDAQSASYALNASTSDTASHATFAENAEDAQSSSYASNASTADTASHATFAETAQTALTASAVSFTTLNQDLTINGELTINGDGTNFESALEISNGVPFFPNLPSGFANDAAAAAAGIPIGGLYRNGNFILIRIA